MVFLASDPASGPNFSTHTALNRTFSTAGCQHAIHIPRQTRETETRSAHPTREGQLRQNPSSLCHPVLRLVAASRRVTGSRDDGDGMRTSTTTPTTSRSTRTRIRSGNSYAMSSRSTTTRAYDFFALSRFEDVDQCSKDWETYISSRGTVLELIKSGAEMPPASIIFEDPPAHHIHRRLLSRVFTPRNISDLEPKIRELCARSLDPLIEQGGFDFIADLGAQMPMRTIGMLLGIPEADQEALRDRIDEGLRLTEGSMPDFDTTFSDGTAAAEGFADYIDWRATHPSDDLMTELLNAEFEDETGAMRRLTRQEVLGYVNLIAAAGNETTTRLIGWTGKVLADHPDQRRQLVDDRSLVPGAIEELLRFESPSPVQARYVTGDVEHHGRPVPAGSTVLLLTASANRDERRFPDADTFDIRRKIDHHLAFARAPSQTATGQRPPFVSSVKFGSANATSFKVESEGVISAVAPAGSGEVDVTVTTTGGTSALSSADRFTYPSEPSASYTSSIVSTPEAEFHKPTAVAVDPAGDIWVADGAHDHVVEFGPKHEYLRQVGSEGSGEGQFRGIPAVATNATGDLFAVDQPDGRIEEFSPAGVLVRTFGSTAPGAGQLHNPCAIAIDESGNIWVLNAFWQSPENGRLVEFSSSSLEPIREFGARGTGPGELLYRVGPRRR